MYRAHPNGWNLNLGDHSVIPRYLHIVNGAIALFSAILAYLGMRKMKVDAEYGRWIVQRSALIFTACTGLQFLLGMWLLLAIRGLSRWHCCWIRWAERCSGWR